MTTQTLSRRKFVSSTLSAGAASLGLSTLARSDETNRSKIKYIDIHTHLGSFYYGRELTPDALVRFMDAHDVEQSVILPLVSPEAAPFPQTTESAIAAHRQHPQRLIPFCCVDPRCLTVPPQRQGHVAGVKGLIQILRQYQDAGCRGLGEHKTGLAFDAKPNMYLYEACQELGLPILFHLDDIRNPDTPGLPRLERVLKMFPELPLIGHAAGFWASISGTATMADFGRYPRIPTPVAPGGALDRLMARYSNLYGDLSEPGGERAIARDRRFGREFLIRRADQLLFGTDVLMPNQEIPHFELLSSLDLPEVVQYKIYRGNALRLLKLDVDK
ncbi:MAG: amidohydrolase family protein [Pirellulaceae bacterium]|jgi:hypothetical protein|nr:amidohydrolase family protein [Pirellulaceae bacterium]